MDKIPRLKTTVLIILFFLTVASCPGIASASQITVVFNGTPIICNPPPQIVDNRILIPIRPIIEGLKINPEHLIFDENTMTAIIKHEQYSIEITAGNSFAFVNDKKIPLSAPAKVIDDRVYVPLRFIAEALNSTVRWDDIDSTVYITFDEPETNSNKNKMDTVEVAAQKDSIVAIFLKGDELTAQGSGVIVDSSGVIVTNYHVIDGNTVENIVLFDGREFLLEEILYYDKKRDIAFLKISGEDFSFAALGNSDNLELGQEVMAIGNPYGLQNTISTGIISGARTFDDLEYIQISVPITYGSSGGGLFDKDGKLVGITEWGFDEANLNFAIPVNDVINCLNEGLTPSLAASIFWSNVKVASLKFFESAKDEPLQRIYTNRFSRDKSRYICWELNLEHPQPGKRIDFDIRCIYYGPDGIIHRNHSVACNINSDWHDSIHTGSTGNDEPGKWDKGLYKVELYVNGDRITEGDFVMH